MEDHTRYEEPPQVPRRRCRAAIDREPRNIDGDGVDVVPNGSEQDQSADGAYGQGADHNRPRDEVLRVDVAYPEHDDRYILSRQDAL